ncbi:PTS sugar transporter subunit IIA [Acidomonas methanolica]|uniref:Phosphotransferase system permease nitrogen regulatory IIA protein n=1 Tax=Acidomonas methanolica NBRC 104435 TaxID=1231351 RepID=A0A023D2I0_ACIMT|nr:PTS sugar transporter subunit IIA [Acidomonas methanolica]MBU2654152.1 PTS sugar transporter subunit IIA [Acidomonas methanolica]TCS30619.1 PTS system mannose-specific IIA component [Acidomonas methanolica]GAJ28337.1 phosphotransferase system permease nitrogen regulatory IIA protein [Acidomonas methanolica NBRC 104435]GBQ45955.1 PTS system transporter subunit IIA [Acidomonas methanolica]GEK98821.1 PTS fructose transporter subunit IIA [Acidomonas methanolica NBRC 104435]
MIGIVLITHGHLGESLRDIVEHVVGPQHRMETIAVEREDEIATLRPALLDAVHRVDDGSGVLVLTDIFGSTPSNLALTVRRPGHVEIIAGVNMPMLVKLAKTRAAKDLAGCIELATEAGRKYIAAASELPESCLQGGKCCTAVLSSPTLSSLPHPVAAPAAIIPLRRAIS